VRLPKDALISDEKLTKYLLAPKKRNDKSKWLARAGYVLETWSILKDDLRKQILPKDASLVESTEYGRMYEIRARLKGPNGKTLPVCTIWMAEKATETTKFVTMYPDRR
jgi:hypothetical protein